MFLTLLRVADRIDFATATGRGRKNVNYNSNSKSVYDSFGSNCAVEVKSRRLSNAFTQRRTSLHLRLMRYICVKSRSM